MKDKIAKWLVMGAVISAVIMVVGFFLWTNLVPLQDMGSYSPRELREVQKELAINYPLGSFLLNLGFVGFSSSLLGLVLRQVVSYVKKKQ